MAKGKTIKAARLQLPADILITAASMKDGVCHYSFEIIEGVGQGDKHSVKGSGFYEDELANAFRKLNVHLAYADDAFITQEIEAIDKHHSDETTMNYMVTGFKVKGTSESLESVQLIGTKRVAVLGDRMDIETPRIALDSLSSYKFHKELLDAVNSCQVEVYEYRNGKCTHHEEEETQVKGQLTIGDNIEEQE